jgi:hypothetical protein
MKLMNLCTLSVMIRRRSKQTISHTKAIWVCKKVLREKNIESLRIFEKPELMSDNQANKGGTAKLGQSSSKDAKSLRVRRPPFRIIHV